MQADRIAAKPYADRTISRLVHVLEERKAAVTHLIQSLDDEFGEVMASQDISDLLDDEPVPGTEPQEMLSLVERIQSDLAEIDAALERVEQGSYGLCASCGSRIPLERLEALPATRWCVDCSRRLPPA